MAELCPLCDSAKIKRKFFLTGDHAIYLCRSCSLEFLSPQLNEAELLGLYSRDYYSSWGLKGKEENQGLKKMKLATFDLRLNLISGFKKSGKLLDVGCATGFMLEASENKGFDSFGIELSNYSASIAKQKFGNDKIFEGRLENYNFPGQYFDVISMFDLLEHVRDPRQSLNKAFALLKNDGIIMISTPDTGTTTHFLMGKAWTHYKPEHFFYFNKKSMHLLAEKCNMKVVHYEKSRKALNFNYIAAQFQAYKHPVITSFINLLNRIIGEKTKLKNLYFPIGEMTVVLKKN